MIFDGKAAALTIQAELHMRVQKLREKPRLAIVVIGKHPAMAQFIAAKERFGASIGVSVRIHEFSPDISTTQLRKKLAVMVHLKSNTGIIVQFPLPKHIPGDYIVNAIPPEKDVDVLSSRAVGDFLHHRSLVVPPTVAAITHAFKSHDIQLTGKRIVVIGAGRLVGRPIALWLLREGHSFSLINSGDTNVEEIVRNADVIISGVGKPGMITKDMIKKDAMIIDAGTAEAAGKVRGDADPNVAERAIFVTPVPGGIGPLTVAMVFKNLVELAEKKK